MIVEKKKPIDKNAHLSKLHETTQVSIMRQEEKRTIEAFLNDSSLKFQLAEAGALVDASQKDVTNWRQRKQLPIAPQKVGGRYCVNSRGLIGIGLVEQLAWAIGPDQASKTAKNLLETPFLHMEFYTKDKFSDLRIEISKAPRRIVVGDGEAHAEEEASSGAIYSIQIVLAPELSDVEGRSLLSVPIGRLIGIWSKRCAMLES